VDVALLSTTAGWLPKPQALRDVRARHDAGEAGDEELAQAQAQATRATLRLQQELGLAELVDGQMDRRDMITTFAERLSGMELAGLVRCFGNRYYRKPRIVDRVERTAPITVEAWEAAQRQVQQPVKAILTGPYTLMDWSADEHYRSREKCCLDLAQLLREEAEDLLARGAAVIEIDEPAISTRPEEMPLVAEALAIVTAPLRGRARVWTHVCYGELLPVIEPLLRLPVDGLLLELSHADEALLEALGELPPDKLLGAGVLDVQSPAIEPAGTIRQRLERVLAHVPRERVWAAPDAGLRTLTEEQAAGKLRSLVAAAAAL
jgi:5-methyltetrahydropteroyltriglutamate--homocysteine methyltransferase